MDWLGLVFIVAVPVAAYVAYRYSEAAVEKPRNDFLTAIAVLLTILALSLALIAVVGFNVLWRAWTGSLLLANGVGLLFLAVAILLIVVAVLVMLVALRRYDGEKRRANGNGRKYGRRSTDVQTPTPDQKP